MSRRAENEEKTRIKKVKVYESIVGYMLAHGYPPTIREIGEMSGLKSTCSVSQYLMKLKDEGIIDFDPLASRTITVPGIKYVDTRKTIEILDMQ